MDGETQFQSGHNFAIVSQRYVAHWVERQGLGFHAVFERKRVNVKCTDVRAMNVENLGLGDELDQVIIFLDGSWAKLHVEASLGDTAFNE